MSQVTPSTLKLLERLGMVPQELDMLVRLLKERELDIESVDTYFKSIVEPRQKASRERVVLQLVQDLALAIKENA